MSLALSTRRAALAPGAWVRNELWRRARAVPSLDLRFADSKSLVDATTGQNLVTFTRASSGTYTDSQGVIRTATTNVIWPSEDFTTGWGVAAATRVADAGVAPNGTLTADRIESTGGGVFRAGVTVASGVSYTYSVFIKHVSGTGVISTIGFERFGSVALAGQASFNVLTGAVVSNGAAVVASSITPVGDGWYRISVRATSTDTTTTITNYAAVSGNQFLLWGAQLEQSSTVGEYIPTTSAINSAPRFDHNPITGESLGLLVEEQRTNSVTNNTMVGAVAGTPGTNPTGWVYATAQGIGLTISIAGTGVENGINYIDYRFNGTTVASPNPCAIGIVTTTAATSQTWTASLYWKLAAGSTTGTTYWQLGLIESTAGGTFVTGAFYSQAAPTSAALITQRPTATRTLSGGGTTGLLTFPINIGVAGNTAVDFTIRIGLPQLEQGAFATSVIPTSTAAVTRSADVASISGSNFSSWYRQDEGTVLAEWKCDPSTGNHWPNPAYFDDGTNNNYIGLQYRLPGAKSIRLNVTSGGVPSVSTTANTYAPGQLGKAAGAFKVNDFGVVFAGSTPATSATGSMPSVTTARIGFETLSGSYFNGTIRRLTYWPQRLANNVLQTITQ